MTVVSHATTRHATCHAEGLKGSATGAERADYITERRQHSVVVGCGPDMSLHRWDLGLCLPQSVCSDQVTCLFRLSSPPVSRCAERSDASGALVSGLWVPSHWLSGFRYAFQGEGAPFI